MDGTFATCPPDFYQVYIIHAQKSGQNNLYLPVVYALIKKTKTKETY